MASVVLRSILVSHVKHSNVGIFWGGGWVGVGVEDTQCNKYQTLHKGPAY